MKTETVGKILGWVIVIGMVIWAIPYIIAFAEWLLWIIGFLFLWRIFFGGNSSNSTPRRKKHNGFMSSARDNIPEARNQVPHASDQVSSARDQVSHPFRTDRDRRRGL